MDIMDSQAQEDIVTHEPSQGYSNDGKSKQLKTADYIRKEAIIRIRHYERKKKIEMKILEAQVIFFFSVILNLLFAKKFMTTNFLVGDS